jgi:hypothetical protein
MSYGERSAVVAKHGVEDLSHWQEGTVDAALADTNDSPELVRRVADKDDCSLTRGVSDLTHGHSGDVGGGPQARRRRLVRSESGQVETSDESRGLIEIDARDTCELLRPGSLEPRDASKVAGESPRSLQPVLPS